MKVKKILALSLSVAMLAGGVLSVSAQGLSDVFSADYYAGKYGDLKANGVTSAEALLNHAVANGIKEGRDVSPILDVAAYRAAYADLDAAFGDDWDAYVDHYLTYGIKEGRTTGVKFDLKDYVAKNADLKAAFGDDYVALAKHYVTLGINENRQGGKIAQAAPKTVSTSSNSGSSNSGNAATTEEPATTAPAEHVHVKGLERGRVNPTCETAGYVEWLCNAKLLENKYDAQGNWIGTGPKLVNGEEVFCDEIWREELPAQHVRPEDDHQVYIKHATCAADGVVKYTCTRCGQPQTEVVPKLEADYTVLVKSVASTSCKLEDCGYDEYQCANCQGTVHANKKVPRAPLPHRLSNDKDATNVVTAPTCTSKGSAYGHCSICGEKVYVTLDFAPHNEEQVTCYADTYTLGDAVRTHQSYQVTYCKNEKCKEILVAIPGAKVNCADNDGDGACDGCKLPMTRNATGQLKEYKVGETFIGTVQ